MHLAEGLQEILEACSLRLDLFKRLVRLLHLADGIGKGIRVNPGHQLDITLVAVVAVPIVRALLAVGIHRQQDIIAQTAVLREVLENALDGHFQARHVFVGKLLADDGGETPDQVGGDASVIADLIGGDAPVIADLIWGDASVIADLIGGDVAVIADLIGGDAPVIADLIGNLLCEATAHHHAAPFPKRLHRVAGKNRPVEDLEKAGIGTDERGFELVSLFVQIGVAIEDIRGAGTRLNARDLFHEAHRYGAAHLAVILLVPLH